MRVMGRDDVYPVKTFKVGCLLHYVIAAATTVFSTPDDGRRKCPKHVE